ncbi:hypothetical protein [Caballeronia sp. GAWG2-1]|uniref:hypothetical protein n=1 Tax=Caballeronia sp. GAWG2-1 TaxID=2921744 RepID=UPI0020293386|nr:hypothetical protein [Caballeronia sp. GAWG2-1]
MSKNKLLIAIAAGLLSATTATGAMAQTSSGNSSAAMGQTDTGASTDGTSSSGTTKHKMRKHSAHPSAGKKTPDVETGNNAAAESGQSK